MRDFNLPSIFLVGLLLLMLFQNTIGGTLFTKRNNNNGGTTGKEFSPQVVKNSELPSSFAPTEIVKTVDEIQNGQNKFQPSALLSVHYQDLNDSNKENNMGGHTRYNLEGAIQPINVPRVVSQKPFQKRRNNKNRKSHNAPKIDEHFQNDWGYKIENKGPMISNSTWDNTWENQQKMKSGHGEGLGYFQYEYGWGQPDEATTEGTKDRRTEVIPNHLPPSSYQTLIVSPQPTQQKQFSTATVPKIPIIHLPQQHPGAFRNYSATNSQDTKGAHRSEIHEGLASSVSASEHNIIGMFPPHSTGDHHGHGHHVEPAIGEHSEGHGHHGHSEMGHGHSPLEQRITISKTLIGSKALKKGTALVILAAVIVMIVLAVIGSSGAPVSPIVFPLAILPIALIAFILFIPLIFIFVPLVATGLAGERRRGKRSTQSQEQLQYIFNAFLTSQL